MPYEIHVRGNSAPGEAAAVVTAFNNLMTALRAGTPTAHVDAGGSFVDVLKLTGDEVIPADETLPQGQPF